MRKIAFAITAALSLCAFANPATAATNTEMQNIQTAPMAVDSIAVSDDFGAGDEAIYLNDAIGGPASGAYQAIYFGLDDVVGAGAVLLDESTVHLDLMMSSVNGHVAGATHIAIDQGHFGGHVSSG